MRRYRGKNYQRYNRIAYIPRDLLGYSRTLIDGKTMDVYTTTLTLWFRSSEFWGQNANPQFAYNNFKSSDFPLIQGYADLAAAFSTVRVNWATADFYLSNLTAGFNSNCFVAYANNTQLVDVRELGPAFFEHPGVQTRHLQANRPHARFRLSGSLLNETRTATSNPGYVMSDGLGVYISTGSLVSAPTIAFGNFGVWCPFGDLSQPSQGNAMVVRFTFGMSFAKPILNRAA